MDETAEVVETNEGNNTMSEALTVTGGAPPDLDVTHWLVPAAASAVGANNSDWRTQLVVNNPTGQARQATLYYVENGDSWPGQLLVGPVNVGVNKSLYLNDPLAAMRDTSGFMYVVLDQSGPVVTTRTFNLKADGSTFGQGIPAIALTGATSPSEMVIPLVHSGNDWFHTNLGLVQTSIGTMILEISIYTSAGTLLTSGTRTVSDAWDQFDVFNLFGLGSAHVEGGWIRVRLASGSPDFWTCYASVIDDETGDGTYVPGVVPGG